MWGSTLLALTLIGLVRSRGERFSQKYVLAVIIVVRALTLDCDRGHPIPCALEGVLTVFAGYGLDLLVPTFQSQVQKHLPRWTARAPGREQLGPG